MQSPISKVILLLIVILIPTISHTYEYKIPVSPIKVTPIQKEISLKLFHDGTKYLLKGYFEQAIENFDKAIKLNPFLLEAYYLKGRALFHLGKIQKASLMFRYYLQVNPDDKRAEFNLKQIFYYFKTSWDTLPITPNYKYRSSYDLSDPDKVVSGSTLKKLKYKFIYKPINITYITRSHDYLYACDLTGKKLLIFNRYILFKNAIRKLNYPTDVEISSNGDIFVVESGKGIISQFNKNLLKLREFGKDTLFYPQNIFIDELRNSLWVTDWADNSIKEIDLSTGKLKKTMGNKLLSQPTSIVVNKKGIIVVSDLGHHSVKLFDTHGNYLKEILGSVKSHCIRIDRAGNIFILDEISRIIYVFNSKFENINIIVLPSVIKDPVSFTISPNQDILVSSFTVPSIYILSPKYPEYLNIPSFITIKKIDSKLPKIKLHLSFNIGWIPYCPEINSANTILLEDQQLSDIWRVKALRETPRVTHALVIMDKSSKKTALKIEKEILKSLTANYRRYLIREAWTNTKSKNFWQDFKNALISFAPTKTTNSIIIYIGREFPDTNIKIFGQIILFCRLESLPIFAIGIGADPYTSKLAHISLLTGGEPIPSQYAIKSTYLQDIMQNPYTIHSLYMKSQYHLPDHKIHWIKATIKYRKNNYTGDGIYTLP